VKRRATLALLLVSVPAAAHESHAAASGPGWTLDAGVVVPLALALLVLLVVCASFGYPPQTVWPIFSAAFLILACTAVLLQGAFEQLPLTRQPSELIAMYLVGVLYLGWGIRATWKAYSMFA